MMDWFTKWLPDSTDLYWAVVCVALAVLNVWQFARAHGLAMFEKLVKKDGHAPEGKVLVPAASVAIDIAPDQPAATRRQNPPKGYL